jgi:hypothetical protein
MIQHSLAPPLPRAFSSIRPPKMPAPLRTTSVKATAKASTQPAQVWNLNELHPLPVAYPLERSNVYVANCSPQEVAYRICETLRTESIAATFSHEDKVRLTQIMRSSTTGVFTTRVSSLAKQKHPTDALFFYSLQNLLIADTKDCVQFAVRLFADQDKVVVEIQRKTGCSFLFHQVVKAVLRSAKGMTSAEPHSNRRFTIPSCVPKETQEEKQKCMEEGLGIAFNLLKNDRLDAHMLAMESLSQLTRATECKAFAANKVLCGDFMERLISLVESGLSLTPLSELEQQHFTMMHRHALTVLANSLSAIDESGELLSVLSIRSELTSKSLLAALVSDLEAANERPHDACQAARCIQALVRSAQVKAELIDLDAMSVIFSACTAGAGLNAMLEQESKKLRLHFA